MGYLGIAFILIIAYIVRYFDNKSEQRSRDKVEVTHQKMYDLIDTHFGADSELAREYKAETDAYICGVWQERGRDYSPIKVKQVTTAKERKERVKAENTGKGEIYRANKKNKAMLLDAIDNARLSAFADAVMADTMYCPTTPENGKERTIRKTMEVLGMSYDEASAHVERLCRELRLT